MIVEGETYSSPLKGRNILVSAIDKEDAENYSLSIEWVDKSTGETEPDHIVVSKQDTLRWTKVDF